MQLLGRHGSHVIALATIIAGQKRVMLVERFAPEYGETPASQPTSMGEIARAAPSDAVQFILPSSRVVRTRREIALP